MQQLARSCAHADRAGDSSADEIRIRQWGQVNEPNAVRTGLDHGCRDLQREPGLTDATRTGQCHEPYVSAQQRAIVLYLLFAANKAGQEDRQVVAAQQRAGNGRAF